MSDTNWKSYYGDNPDVSGFTNPPNPGDYDDIMKFSDCTNVFVADMQVNGGMENALDMVRGSNYRFYRCHFANAPVSSATIKGSIDGWKMGECSCNSIELGMFDNYWYPGRPPTRNGWLKDMVGKTKVVCWDAEPPKVENSSVKIVRVPKFIWYPYFLFRRWQINK
jgi:hypothetical protein